MPTAGLAGMVLAMLAARRLLLRHRPVLTLCGVVFLALISWPASVVVAEAEAGANPVPADASANIEGASLVLEGMTYTVSEGEMNELVVDAQKATLRPELDEAFLEGVHVRMGSRAPGGIPGGGLEMRCREGVFDLETRDFVATGDVRGVTADGRRFRTEKLRYRASDGLVRSDQPVVLREKDTVLEGTGFEYYVRADRFRLRDARIRQGGS